MSNVLANYEKRKKQSAYKSRNQNNTRYYFWTWCLPYGWRQKGSSEGYATLTKLKRECKWEINNSDNWKILKASYLDSKIEVDGGSL